MNHSFLKLILIALTVIPQFSWATVYNCIFTEPFYQIVVDTEKNSMDIVEMGEDPSHSPALPSVFEGMEHLPYYSTFVPKYGELFHYGLFIDQAAKGSDGMSDCEYPHDARLYLNGDAHSFWGGCETVERKRVCPE